MWQTDTILRKLGRRKPNDEPQKQMPLQKKCFGKKSIKKSQPLNWKSVRNSGLFENSLKGQRRLPT